MTNETQKTQKTHQKCQRQRPDIRRNLWVHVCNTDILDPALRYRLDLILSGPTL